jgi:hypothetical protein
MGSVMASDASITGNPRLTVFPLVINLISSE